jgi:hypothetical protein
MSLSFKIFLFITWPPGGMNHILYSPSWETWFSQVKWLSQRWVAVFWVLPWVCTAHPKNQVPHICWSSSSLPVILEDRRRKLKIIYCQHWSEGLRYWTFIGWRRRGAAFDPLVLGRKLSRHSCMAAFLGSVASTLSY